ncbi:MAG: DUF2490 domain-containing protein [Pyrinomonadaceae bacterium]
MRSHFKLLFALIFLVGSSIATSAQTPTPTPVDDDDIQSWNDISVTIPLNKKVDLYVPVTFRFDENATTLHEGRIGGGLVFKPHKSVSIAPTYLFIQTRNSAGAFRREDRLSLGVTYRFPTKSFGLAHRSQFEFRHRASGNTWRYRPSVTVDKHLPDDWVKGLKLYVTEEPFYDSASGRFSRNRLTLGVNKVLTKKLSVDLYYLRQDDNFSHPGLAHVIGTAWKIKL